MKLECPRVLAVLVLVVTLIGPRTPVTAQDRGLGVGRRASEKRLALVIGNSAYPDAPLTNPVNDARSMRRALASLGFEVLYGEDRNQSQMKELIREFGQRLKGGGVGLFYFAGHGVQVGGRNYLIPVGSSVGSESEVEYEGVDVGRVLGLMGDAANSLNIVILDACRNNPFARSYRSSSNGLASVDAPTGTLIAYATAPGSVASDGRGENGLYTQELLKSMSAPGLSVEEVFKRVRVAVRQASAGRQVPWESSSLVGNFYFAGAAEQPAGTRASGAGGVGQAAVELSVWSTIQNSADPEDFKEYLQKYPNGQFAGFARRRVAALSGTAQPSASPAENTARPAPAASGAVKTESAEAGKETPEQARARIQEANRVAQELNEKLPKVLEAGNTAFSNRRFEEAAAHYEQGIQLDPTQAVFHRNKAIVLRAIGVERFNTAFKAKDMVGQEAARKDLRLSAETSDRALEVFRQNPSRSANRGEELGYLFDRAESYRVWLTVDASANKEAGVKAIQEYIGAEPDKDRKAKFEDFLKKIMRR